MLTNERLRDTLCLGRDAMWNVIDVTFDFKHTW